MKKIFVGLLFCSFAFAALIGCGKVVEDIPPGATSNLPAPTSFSASAGTLQVSVSWEAVAGASAYNLYFSNTSGVTPANGTKISTVTRPYIHTGLVNGRNYYYIATSVDAASGESVASLQIVATPENVGTLDATFNSTGVVVHNGAGGANSADMGNGIAIDANGKILVTGTSGTTANNFDMVVWRFDPDGQPDLTFGSSGVITNNNAAGGNRNDYGTAITVDANQNILVAGRSYNIASNYDMALWRLTSTGALDPSFGGGDGIVISQDTAGAVNDDEGKSVTLDMNGKIVVGGYSYSVAKGKDMVVWRYNTDGTADTTFATTGYLVYAGFGYDVEECNAITTDSIGRVMAAGKFKNSSGDDDMFILRIQPNGTADTSFGSSSGVFYNSGNGGDGATSLTLDPSGKILACGYNRNANGDIDVAVWRYNSGGSADTTFGTNGVASHTGASGSSTGIEIGYAMTIDPAGKILVAGAALNGTTYLMTVWRFNTNGTIDTTFGNSGFITYSNAASTTKFDIGYAITCDASGRIVVTGLSANSMGDYDMAIWRYK